MKQQTQTIVTNEELEQQVQENAVTPGVPYEVKDNRVGTETVPEVEGGYPQESYQKATHKELKEIGVAEATKEAAQKSELNTNKFENLVKKNTSRTLFKIKSAKILDFFPDEVAIETTKVNISLRDYFFMRRLHTISIEDITDVFVETTPFYATLKIIDKDFVENSIQVQFLKKDQAKKARRIIQGLVTAYKENVDIASLPDEGLVEKLETLGTAGEVEEVGK